MKDFLVEHKPLIEVTRALMTKLSNLIPTTKLQILIHLKAKTNNETRWSFTLAMLEQLLKIENFILQSDILEVDAQGRDLKSFFDKLRDLESATLALQQNNVTLSEALAFFDATIDSSFAFKSLLGRRALIVENKAFELALVEIQR